VRRFKLAPQTGKNWQLSIAKFGMFVRFYVFNSTVYSVESFDGGIIKATDSSRYKEYQNIIDSAIQDLKNEDDGCYLYYSPPIGWISVPVSVEEMLCVWERYPDLKIPSNIHTPIYPVIII